MNRVIYYVTSSLDGFIADVNGGVDWLRGAPGEDYGYAKFYSEMDAVLLGSGTYSTVLDFDVPFPYHDKPVYVFSSREDLPRVLDNVEIVNESPEKFVARLKLKGEGKIWLGGGGKLASTLLAAGLVDELQVFVQPVVLGDGIPLFARSEHRAALELVGSRTWPGNLVELRYRVRKPWRSDAELGI